MELPSNATVLFHGDSITDAGRSYENCESLGAGYVMIAVGWFSALFPERNLRFLNRGISGSRIRDLRDRWKKDCLDPKPDVASILIGINDTMKKHVWSSTTSIESFERDYRIILEHARTVLKSNVILMEPFVLDMTKEQLLIRKDLDPKLEVVRKLSREFEAVLVPLDRIFKEATKRIDPLILVIRWNSSNDCRTHINCPVLVESLWDNLTTAMK
jgi:lysophospholipase L1-like esterase